jgi:branched-chain amino acid transport system permease protein
MAETKPGTPPARARIGNTGESGRRQPAPRLSHQPRGAELSINHLEVAADLARRACGRQRSLLRRSRACFISGVRTALVASHRSLRAPRGQWPALSPQRLLAGGVLAIVAVWLGVNFLHGPATFVNLVFIGVTIGALYGLVALGYTLVYGVVERFNFAHGDVFIYGAMIAASASRWLDLREDAGLERLVDTAVMFALAIGLSSVTSLLVERIAFRPFLRAPRLASLVTVIGVTFVLEDIALIWQGDNFDAIPRVLPDGRIFDAAGVHYTWDGLIVLGATTLLALGLRRLLGSTRAGKAMRATAQDLDAAELLGIDVARVVSLTFVIGGAIAGAAGALYLLYEQYVTWDLGFHLGLTALAASVLGGIGNPAGAFLGAMLIGLTQSFNEGFTWYTPGSDWTSSIVFVVLIGTLVFRPEGILGDPAR